MTSQRTFALFTGIVVSTACSNCGARANTVPEGTTERTGSARSPTGPNPELKLTWVVYPPMGESEGGPTRNVELIARLGDRENRVTLGPQTGTLVPSQQSVCDPTLKDATRVSSIRFNTMGPKTIVARRVQPALLEIDFTVDADDDPSKTHGTLATIPIPSDAHIVDAISEIRRPGDEGSFECSGTLAQGRDIAESKDGTTKVVRKGSTLVVRRARADVDLPPELAAGAKDDAIRVSPDGRFVGIFNASTAPPTLTVYDVEKRTVRAKRSPSQEIVGGTVDARFGTEASSIEWIFSRADCELQDVDTGKPRCGACDNSGYAAFTRGQDKSVKPILEKTTRCLK